MEKFLTAGNEMKKVSGKRKQAEAQGPAALKPVRQVQMPACLMYPKTQDGHFTSVE